MAPRTRTDSDALAIGGVTQPVEAAGEKGGLHSPLSVGGGQELVGGKELQHDAPRKYEKRQDPGFVWQGITFYLGYHELVGRRLNPLALHSCIQLVLHRKMRIDCIMKFKVQRMLRLWNT